MAELIDESQEEEETQITESQAEQQEETQEEPQEELPEKYQGKSLKDVIRMHQEAESLAGRHSQEVGELRKLADTFIQEKLETAPKPEPEEEIDFFTEPEKAVARAIESHPKIKEAEKAAEQLQKTAALSDLQTKHPDTKEILQDSGFGEWVTGSNLRQNLFKRADSQYDYEAADELFSLWKERKQVVEQTAVVEKEARKQTVRQASTGNTKGSAEPASRKVYRRADIIKLMKDDPDRYEAMADELTQAYATGRVK